MTSDLLDQLKSLHTSAIDARSGYRRALEDAKQCHDLAGLFEDMAVLHERNAEELAQILTAAGERPDDSGSFMSIVHRTIMDIRSLLGGLDDSVLPGLIDGEERNARHYDDALKHAGSDTAIAANLGTQRGRLAAAIAGMKARKAAA